MRASASIRASFRAFFGVLVVGFAVAPPAPAVLLYSTPQRNTWAPSGSIYNSGWQYQGRWGAFLGTPIAPRYFITAAHVGGAVGQTFSYRGKTYTTRASYDDPNSDLHIWQVDRNFADPIAPIYRGTSEVGKQVVIYGRGGQRGTDVYVNNQRKGWRWGTSDGLQSWGTNNVRSVVNGGSGVGSVLFFAFDANVSHDEGTLSSGDSGGGTFVNDGGVWKLAGVNFAARGPYSTAGQANAGTNASLYDEGGIWVGQPYHRYFVTDQAANVPGGGYVTRVSADLAWIDSILKRPALSALPPATTDGMTAVPEPGSAALVLVAVAAGLSRRRRHRA
jgi:MYXO-CTERM domain-containing protein